MAPLGTFCSQHCFHTPVLLSPAQPSHLAVMSLRILIKLCVSRFSHLFPKDNSCFEGRSADEMKWCCGVPTWPGATHSAWLLLLSRPLSCEVGKAGFTSLLQRTELRLTNTVTYPSESAAKILPTPVPLTEKTHPCSIQRTTSLIPGKRSG